MGRLVVIGLLFLLPIAAQGFSPRSGPHLTQNQAGFAGQLSSSLRGVSRYSRYTEINENNSQAAENDDPTVRHQETVEANEQVQVLSDTPQNADDAQAVRREIEPVAASDDVTPDARQDDVAPETDNVVPDLVPVNTETTANDNPNVREADQVSEVRDNLPEVRQDIQTIGEVIENVDQANTNTNVAQRQDLSQSEEAQVNVETPTVTVENPSTRENLNNGGSVVEIDAKRVNGSSVLGSFIESAASAAGAGLGFQLANSALGQQTPYRPAYGGYPAYGVGHHHNGFGGHIPPYVGSHHSQFPEYLGGYGSQSYQGSGYGFGNQFGSNQFGSNQYPRPDHHFSSSRPSYVGSGSSSNYYPLSTTFSRPGTSFNEYKSVSVQEDFNDPINPEGKEALPRRGYGTVLGTALAAGAGLAILGSLNSNRYHGGYPYNYRPYYGPNYGYNYAPVYSGDFFRTVRVQPSVALNEEDNLPIDDSNLFDEVPVQRYVRSADDEELSRDQVEVDNALVRRGDGDNFYDYDYFTGDENEHHPMERSRSLKKVLIGGRSTRSVYDQETQNDATDSYKIDTRNLHDFDFNTYIRKVPDQVESRNPFMDFYHASIQLALKNNLVNELQIKDYPSSGLNNNYFNSDPSPYYYYYNQGSEPAGFTSRASRVYRSATIDAALPGEAVTTPEQFEAVVTSESNESGSERNDLTDLTAGLERNENNIAQVPEESQEPANIINEEGIIVGTQPGPETGSDRDVFLISTSGLHQNHNNNPPEPIEIINNGFQDAPAEQELKLEGIESVAELVPNTATFDITTDQEPKQTAVDEHAELEPVSQALTQETGEIVDQEPKEESIAVATNQDVESSSSNVQVDQESKQVDSNVEQELTQDDTAAPIDQEPKEAETEQNVDQLVEQAEVDVDQEPKQAAEESPVGKQTIQDQGEVEVEQQPKQEPIETALENSAMESLLEAVETPVETSADQEPKQVTDEVAIEQQLIQDGIEVHIGQEAKEEDVAQAADQELAEPSGEIQPNQEAKEEEEIEQEQVSQELENNVS